MITTGAIVRVVDRADETLPESFVGRLGRVVARLPYQEIGDDPDTDPVWLVAHPPEGGPFAEEQIYWTEEIDARPLWIVSLLSDLGMEGRAGA